MKNNLFVTFEGPEGSGKSTLIKIISKELKKLNIKNIKTREPGGKSLVFAEKIRELILRNKNLDPLTEALLFEASRRENLTKVIIPALKKNYLVLCDRFIDSTFIYQGVLGKVGKEMIEKLNLLTIGKYLPDITFIFDVKPEVALKRISSSKRETNRFDNLNISMHNKIYIEYLRLSKSSKRFILINANQEIKKIVEEILSHILRKRKK